MVADVQRAKMDISFFLTNVYEAATVRRSARDDGGQLGSDLQRVCGVVREEFLPKGYLPYLPDTNFVMCSYAVSFYKQALYGRAHVQLLSLLKLLKPELRPYHDSEDAIFKLVE